MPRGIPQCCGRRLASSTSTPIALVLCGSFSPITFMHLRALEEARLAVEARGNAEVIAGYISPVHDDYGKSSLIPATHRIAMCSLAARQSNWIQVAEWESLQETWTPTHRVLNAFKEELMKSVGSSVKVLLVMGSDVLLTFLDGHSWTEEQRKVILGDFGVVCIARRPEDSVQEIVSSNQILKPFAENIIPSSCGPLMHISSSLVRDCFARNESCAYLVPTEVLRYIEKNQLYGCKPGSQHVAI